MKNKGRKEKDRKREEKREERWRHARKEGGREGGEEGGREGGRKLKKMIKQTDHASAFCFAGGRVPHRASGLFFSSRRSRVAET